MKWKLYLFLATALMALSVSSQAEECLDHIGAGVMMYSFDDSGQQYLLLGYQPGRGWSSFGGGPKNLETITPKLKWCEKRKETAIREGVEEMRLLVPRTTLAELLQNAYSFPAQPTNKDFVTYIVKSEKFDVEPYFSTPVLSESDFTETTNIAWIRLDQLVDCKNRKILTPITPNNEDLWEIFSKGLAKELKNSNCKTLFP